MEVRLKHVGWIGTGVMGAPMAGHLLDSPDHAAVSCSTGGATTFGFEPGTGNNYYLVVPTNGSFEGSYGMASDGIPRGQGASACVPMDAGVCG